MIDSDCYPNPLITRTILVTGMSGDVCELTIQQNLDALPGVRKARANHRTGRVKFTYDPTITRLKTVEGKLLALGYPADDSFWARKKREWLTFMEQNKRDNLAHQGHCCSKLP
uniref:Heavy-metal-associated domain-containing protein n=1 Tax=Candidatus Kentrum sp. FW TaxID=2126338 RepID=A0A450TQT0_9GAMM|nr:MAG: Heavy-metal-associated domain-containing protein [Candidatus Kentron sp. FW]